MKLDDFAAAIGVVLGGVAAIVFLLFGAGCSSYTVVAADRRMVPVRDVGEGNYTYEPTDACTGWYVPNATMLSITDKLNGF